MNYEITVQLKQEVLDPEGRAIKETLGRLGFGELSHVTVAKRYVVSLEAPEKRAAELAEQIAPSIESVLLNVGTTDTYYSEAA